MSRARPASGRAAGAVLALLVAGGAEAGRLPDWAEAIVEHAPPLPENRLEHDSRLLLQETLWSVGVDGTLRTRRRTAAQALTPQAAAIGLGFFPFDQTAQKVRSKAWHVPPEGRAKKSRRTDEVDLALDDLFLSDNLTRVVALPRVETGSLVFFEFESEERPQHLAYWELFYNAVPTDLVRVQVEVPADWEVRHEWLRGAGPDPARNGSRHTWEVAALAPPPLPSPYADAPWETAPLLQIAVVPPAGVTVSPATFSDWRAVGDWYRALATGRDEADDAVRAAVGEALAATPADPLGEISGLARHVRDRVRYVAKSIGIGGYQPRAANEVLGSLYGDCKDKVTLLRAMLKARGHRSYPTLVHATLPDTVSDGVPSIGAFDHLVLAVAVPDGIEPPAHLLPAIVSAGELGRLLLVDVTDEAAAFGAIPAALGGRRALVIGDETSVLLRVPDTDPRSHGLARTLDARWTDDGEMWIDLTEERWGEPAARSRRAHAASQRGFELDTTREIAAQWTGSKVELRDVVREDGTGRFVLRASVTVPATAVSAPVAIFPGAAELLPRTSVRDRETAVVYPFPMTVRVSTRLAGLLSATTDPPPLAADGPGWSVRSTHVRSQDVLESAWELQLGRRRFAKDEFDELQRLWTAVRKSTGPVLERARP